MKKAELLILNKIISTYIVNTKKELAQMQFEAEKLKQKQKTVHHQVITTMKTDVKENIEQYLKSEVNYRLTERIFNKLNDNIDQRNKWNNIQLQLKTFQFENDTSVDVKIDTVTNLPKALELELINKLIKKYENLEEYETCAFLHSKVSELQLV